MDELNRGRANVQSRAETCAGSIRRRRGTAQSGDVRPDARSRRDPPEGAAVSRRSSAAQRAPVDAGDLPLPCPEASAAAARDHTCRSAPGTYHRGLAAGVQ
jgi:hypothetical protein